MKITSQNLYQIGELPTDQLREAILLLAMEVSKEERRLSLKRNRTKKWRERHGDAALKLNGKRHGDARGHGDVLRHGDAGNSLKTNGERHGDAILSIYNTIERKKVSKKGGVGENIEFAEFWKAYPKRVAKQDALKAFCKARKEASKEEILAGVKVLTNNLPQDLKFVPYPATWLNRKQWLDEPSHIATGPKWLNGIPGVI